MLKFFQLCPLSVHGNLTDFFKVHLQTLKVEKANIIVFKQNLYSKVTLKIWVKVTEIWKPKDLPSEANVLRFSSHCLVDFFIEMLL